MTWVIGASSLFGYGVMLSVVRMCSNINEHFGNTSAMALVVCG
jgi:hypothetical protein